MKQTKWIVTFIMAIMLGALVQGCASTPKQESTGQFVDDAVISTKVKAAIVNEPTLSNFEIKVDTYKGIVQLSGFVGSQEKMDKAVEVARGVEGVKDVKNDMQLK